MGVKVGLRPEHMLSRKITMSQTTILAAVMSKIMGVLVSASGMEVIMEVALR